MLIGNNANRTIQTSNIEVYGMDVGSIIISLYWLQVILMN